MDICDLLNDIKKLTPEPASEKTISNIQKIKKICDSSYFNQSFYGNAALNRKMLLDKDIAELLTPDVLRYLFTHDPTEQEKIHRNSGGPISLRDAIFYGFADGLLTIQSLPNNEKNYTPKHYDDQKKRFEFNTSKIIKSIQAAANKPEEKIDIEECHTSNLKALLGSIIEHIDYVCGKGKSNELLSVPTYSPRQIRKQVFWGFEALYRCIGVKSLNNTPIDALCEKFLTSPDAILNGDVIHLFYDRAHLEAALAENKLIQINKIHYRLRDLLNIMVGKISSNPSKYPRCTIEQFYLRLNLVKKDLDKRFSQIAMSQRDEKQPTSMGDANHFLEDSLPKSKYTHDLEMLMRKQLNNVVFTMKKNGSDHIMAFSDGTEYNITNILKYANVEHLRLGIIDFQLYERFLKTSAKQCSSLSEESLTLLVKDERFHNLSRAEMHAINIYTSKYYSEMNQFLRGTYPFDQKKPQQIREIILHSIMCASALTKSPEQQIKVPTYRLEKIFDHNIHQQRIDAAKNEKTLFMSGFISSSIEKRNVIDSNEDRASYVSFKINHVRGRYIAPLSQFPNENEFLIPPTQMRYVKHHVEQYKNTQIHEFETTVCSDLSAIEPEALRVPTIEEIKQYSDATKKRDTVHIKNMLNSAVIMFEDYIKQQISRLRPSFFNSIWFDSEKSHLKYKKYLDCFHNLTILRVNLTYGISDPDTIMNQYMHLISDISDAAKIERGKPILGSKPTKAYKRFAMFTKTEEFKALSDLVDHKIKRV